MPIEAIRNVGIIGVGKMGLPIAGHLLAKGYGVAGFDIRPPRSALPSGLRMLESPAAVAAESDAAIILVGFEEDVDQSLFGENGLLAEAGDGYVVIVGSTVSPGYMRDLPQRLPPALAGRVKFTDVPLCRGEPAAEAGALLGLAGGNAETFRLVKPVLEAFCDPVCYLGELGAGQVAKMVNNMILWACVSANAEGLKLGQALGVEQDTLRNALLQSSAFNWALDCWTTIGPMPWAEKDMSIVLQEADEARLSLPLAGAIKEVVKGYKIERGYGMPGRRAR